MVGAGRPLAELPGTSGLETDAQRVTLVPDLIEDSGALSHDGYSQAPDGDSQAPLCLASCCSQAPDGDSQEPRPPAQTAAAVGIAEFIEQTRNLSSISASSDTTFTSPPAPRRPPRSRSRSRDPGLRQVRGVCNTPDHEQRYIMFDCRLGGLLRQMGSSQIRNLLQKAMHHHSRGLQGQFAETVFRTSASQSTVCWHLDPQPGRPRGAVALVSAEESVCGT